MKKNIRNVKARGKARKKMRGCIIRCAAQLCEKRSACVLSDTEKDSTFLEVMKNSSTNCHATISVSSSR